MYKLLIYIFSVIPAIFSIFQVESKTDVYKRRVFIDQSDMYTHVFSVFEDNKVFS